MHANGTLNGTGSAGRLPRMPSRPRRSAADKAHEKLRLSLYNDLSGAAMSLSGGYENARSTRLHRGGHSITGGSADSQRNTYTRDSLRKQCQHLDRNNVLARGLVQRLIDMVVGDGFTLQVQSKDPKWNEEATKLFNDWSQNRGEFSPEVGGLGIDIRGRSTIDDFGAEAVRCACVEGDLSGVKTIDGQVQMVEAERLRNPSGVGMDGPTSKKTLMIGGVEMDGAGRPLAYHIASWVGMAGGAFPAMQTTPVPAEAIIFLANPIRTITGSTRGEPQLQAALDRFEHLEGFDLAVRVAARMHAILSVYIAVERPELHQNVFPGTVGTEANADGDDQEVKVDELEPGTQTYLKPGEKIQTVGSTQPGPDYESFVLMQLIQIAADLGLPLPLGLLDARQVNLSSIRSVLQLAWRNFERWQEWLRCRWYSAVYRWRIAMFIREGRLKLVDDWDAHTWNAPPAPVMDPAVEIAAARAMVDGCFDSREGQMRQRFGKDLTEVVAQLAREKKIMDDAGVTPAAAPGAGPAAGKPETKPDDDKPEAPNDEDEDAPGDEPDEDEKA